MKLIVGLGNPGPKYETTRHNAGFLVLDLLADHFGIRWEGEQAKFQGEIARGKVWDEDCVFLKPVTFMNLSGRSVAALSRFYKIEPQDIIVLHDDVDVPAAKVKARAGGSHGGNNGIRSIIAETGLENFHRIKLGIGKPEGLNGDVSGWVLGRMTDEELKALHETMFPEVLVRLKGIFQQIKSQQT